ncbi:FRG domain-containing protein [Bradyrhizobium sp.]
MAPAYLFRGEVGWFDECLSRIERVRRDHFPGVTVDELDPIGQDVDEELQSRLAISQKLSRGLMQHYGFPTELMDATTSLETAAFFSRFEARGTVRGAFAVFDMSVLLSGSGTVIGLCDHPTALRARRQEAYAVHHRTHADLKHPKAVLDMGITWYTFLSDPLERSRLALGRRLLSVSDDQTAGLLRLWLDDSVAKHQKVTDPAARYLAHRIAHCPLVTRVISWRGPGQPKEVEPITPDQAHISIDEQLEIDTSIKLWSRMHPDINRR